MICIRLVEPFLVAPSSYNAASVNLIYSSSSLVATSSSGASSFVSVDPIHPSLFAIHHLLVSFVWGPRASVAALHLLADIPRHLRILF